VVLPAGEGLQLQVVFTGIDNSLLRSTDDVDVEWISSDASVVTVSRSGFILARRSGTATISGTVTAPCGTHFVNAVVLVVPGVGIASVHE
jgi:uncharacterized protein YjdB